ncbi:MAG: hypothetical protein AB7K24_21725 [Gemmataceae bacterium]
MPRLIACPKCQKSIRLPDELMGKRIKCPGCMLVFATQGPAPAPAAPAKPGGKPATTLAGQAKPTRIAPGNQPVRPRKTRVDGGQPRPGPRAAPRQAGQPGVRRSPVVVELVENLRGGLLFGIASHFLYLSGLIFVILYFFQRQGLASVGTEDNPGEQMLLLSSFLLKGAGFLQVLLGWLLAVVSVSFFLQVPLRHGVRSYGTALLVMTVLVLLNVAASARLLDAPQTVGDTGKPGAQFNATLLIAFVFEVTRLSLFAWMLRGICRSANALSLASLSRMLGILTPGIMLGALVFAVLLPAVTEAGPHTAAIQVASLFGAPVPLLAFGLFLMARLKGKLEARRA